MTHAKIDYAISMALIFINKAKNAKHEIGKKSLVLQTGCRETATMKRASMDLTHALADLRNPNK
jgi:hypothetical protein